MIANKTVEVYGDSVLRGVQLNPQNMRYHIDNNIGVEAIEQTYSLQIRNYAKFGCTITKGFSLIEKRLSGDTPPCDAIVMEFGGNDCDFNWKAISERPDDDHLSNTTIDHFAATYRKIIQMITDKGIRPIITTLPPLDAKRFFHWFCKGLNKANVMKWLGSMEVIYRWQEHYSRTAEKIASETNTLLVDLRGAFLRHKYLDHFLCKDGTHPNNAGQQIITQAFVDFIENAKDKKLILL
jgi:lysophospholipase L1-like esterase